MTLTEILEEISVGYHQHDTQSEKLQQYVREIIEVLTADNAIYEGKKVSIKQLNEKWGHNLDGDTFLQGSYGTNTAIKHKLYNIDADIAFIIDNDVIDLNIRELIYKKLFKTFGHKYIVDKKKPCITIDFKNKYKIDVAIYTRVGKNIYFHNSIGGMEKIDAAKPKELVSYFNSCYKENDTRRKVIRLIKHFIKTSSMLLEIQDCNRIPSISINLLLCEKSMHGQANEEELYQDIMNSMKYIQQFVNDNGYEGPKCDDLCVGNTFYKVKNINEVKKVIEKIIINLQHKQYNQIIENDVYERINAKKVNKVDNSFSGTMG